jgi:hypothetical protein
VSQVKQEPCRPAFGLLARSLHHQGDVKEQNRERRRRKGWEPVRHVEEPNPIRPPLKCCRGLLETRQRRAVASEAANKSARALGVAAAWSWFELAAAVWTDLAQRLCAARAKCAFVAADEGITFRRKRRATALALLLHLESHTPDITFRRGCHPRLRRASLLTCVTSRRAECDVCRRSKTRQRPALSCCQEREQQPNWAIRSAVGCCRAFDRRGQASVSRAQPFFACGPCASA